MKGIAHKFGSNISTDHIAPGRYFHLRSNLEKLALHVLEDANIEFSKCVKPGDFVVADKNFGCGSSREHAPRIIKLAGIQAVLAKSFARIFYRNAINVGLALVECDTDKINHGDELKIHLEEGIVTNFTTGETISFHSLPAFMINILNEGGIVNHLKIHHGFKI